MAKYIPQYLFDGLVVRWIASDLADAHEGFQALLRDYAEKYPDEDIDLLMSDIRSSAGDGLAVIKRLTDAGVYRYASDVLRDLTDVLEQAASLQKPMWRRMVENLLLNVQPKPIPDRVPKARAHVRAAGDVLQERATAVR
jgi:hypothetical protein